jgi:membrane protein YqaA with SNARE-associated domain
MSPEVVGGLFVASAVSGLVPLVSAELLVVGAAGAAGPAALPAIALASASGQMVSKTMLYVVARWAPARLPERAQDALRRAARGAGARPSATWTTLLASAGLGLPPFYGVSLAAGALRVRSATFVSLGFLGRFVRFGALAAAASWGVSR